MTLLHANARYGLAAAAYVLMPDHIHLLWMGERDDSADQRIALEFLRRYAAPALSPARWQHQAFDHVLRDDEREFGAFQAVAQYILDNPVRAGLVGTWHEYPFVGSIVAGYPAQDLKADDYWETFWRICSRGDGGRGIDRITTRSRS